MYWPINQHKRGALSRLLVLALLGLVISTTSQPGSFVRAQDADGAAPDAAPSDPNADQGVPEDDDDQTEEYTKDQIQAAGYTVKDFNTDLESSPLPLIKIQSINPENGPTTGETRVLVRGGPFGKWEEDYPKPLCKFGDQVVRATYVTCAQNKTDIQAHEARKKDRTFRCLQCDNNQGVQFDQTVQFTVSVTGDFSDALNSVPFQYYPPTRITAIYPRYGPKDGGTPVQIWGENFIDFGQNTRCGFGTRTTVANVFNSTYMECKATRSDVVEKPIPFTVSLNNQQNSRDTLFFWYYNWPSIDLLDPDRGPEPGGTQITLQGRNFFPFKEMLDEIDNANDTFCAFIDLKVRTLAVVSNSTRAHCVSPPSYYWHQTRVELTLNGVEYTEDENIFYYYKPPEIFDVWPRQGPVRGGTEVYIEGNFEEIPGVSPHGPAAPSRPGEGPGQPQRPGQAGQPGQPVLFNDRGEPITRNPNGQPVDGAGNPIFQCENGEPLGRGPNGEPIQYGTYGQPFYYGKDNEIMPLNNTADCTIVTRDGVPVTFGPGGVPLRKDDDSPIFFGPKGEPLEPEEGAQIVPTSAGGEPRFPLKCKFNGIEVNATLVPGGEVKCDSPAQSEPGLYDLEVSFEPGKWSAPVKYLYYMDPTVTEVGPTCGPDSGFTQIEIKGKHFVDLGNNQALCVFNDTIFTNATVMSNELLYCDSPPFQTDQGYSKLGTNGEHGNFYYMKLSMDGGGHIGGKPVKFTYYKQPKIDDVNPPAGPQRGGTTISVTPTGLKQEEICDIRVRLSTFEFKDDKVVKTDDNKLQVVSPRVQLPGTVIVQVAYNGQQFTDERIIHLKDPKSSFEYYQEPIVTYHSPIVGPSNGGTKVKIQGHGFAPFTAQDGSDNAVPQNKLFVRMVNPQTKAVLVDSVQIKPEEMNNNQAIFYTQPQPGGTKALIQISLNNQNWVNVRSPNSDYSFSYYELPKLLRLTPGFGPVKDPNDSSMDIEGTDFTCPESSCKDLKVRFGEGPHNSIYVPAELISPTKIRVKIPKYTKPDVLKVEVALNGIDYTSSNLTFGYYDPYVLDAQPRLIAIDGSTDVTVSGLGFVDSGELKVVYRNNTDPIVCNGACVKSAKFVDKNHLTTTVFPQKDMNYKNSGKNVGLDKYFIEVSVYGDQYTDNKIALHYYTEGDYFLDPGVLPETPSNIPSELLFNAQFDPRDMDKIKRYADPKCRFTADDGTVVYSDAVLVTLPFEIALDKDLRDPNSIKCKTPLWNLKGKEKETVKLDVSLNGQSFRGGFQFTFTETLKLHRTVPMAGPLDGDHITRLIGQGFKPSNEKLQINSKWGPILTEKINKQEVMDYVYERQSFENIIQGSEEIKAYWYEAQSFNRVDSEMYEQWTYHSIYHQSPRILLNSPKASAVEYQTTYGGPWYVEVGRNIPIPTLAKPLDTSRHRMLSDANSTVAPVAANETTVESVPVVNATVNQTTTQAAPAPEIESAGVAQPQTVVEAPISEPVAAPAPVAEPAPVVNVTEPAPSPVAEPVAAPAPEPVAAPVEQKAEVVPAKTPLPPPAHTEQWTYYDYEPAAVEFYQYKQCEMIAMHPHRGFTKGNTQVEVIGLDFRNMPEYGVVPHAKYGDKIVRCIFDSTVRIVCPSPPSDVAIDNIPFEVSLNGADWTKTGFTFSYFEEPILENITPDSGPAIGGTEIFFEGKKLPKMEQNPEFNCKFTAHHIKVPPKIVPASYVNDTAVSCPSPSGWGQGDKMSVQITFNGGDYDNKGFTFTQFGIQKAYPRSGPSNGKGGDIVISGQGFKPENNPQCRLNGTLYEPVSVSWTEIRCPMPKADSDDFFGNVDFAITANGRDWHEFEGGFQYYQQPIVNDIFPRTGPAAGVGIINIYGDNFRADYNLASLGCKIGNSIGSAVYVSKQQIRCIVEDMETVPDGDKLPVQAALNSYSWTQVKDDDDSGSTYFVPYSIQEIYPSSGPIMGGTEVIVQGRGFIQNELDMPRCRFGSPSNYAIVEAEILSYNRLVCRSPPGMTIKKPAMWPLDVPFAIALNSDNFEPWTETSHKFRYYKQPVIDRIVPSEVAVGLMTEVVAVIERDESTPENVFFEPLPSKMHYSAYEDEEQAPMLTGGSGAIKCSFGRFGETIAVYVNATAVKCITPSVPDDPDSIYQESVQFAVAMNGYDYMEEESEIQFTFIGTGSFVSLGPIILGIFAIGLLAAAAIIFFQNYFTSLNFGQEANRRDDRGPHVGAGADGFPDMQRDLGPSRQGRGYSRQRRQ